MSAPRMFKSDVIGAGPFCVEFRDGEIVEARSEEKQRLIAAAPTMYAYIEARETSGDTEAKNLLENIHASR